MTSRGKADLASEPWLGNPQTRAVIEAIEREGGPDCVRFVGGCVRNALTGREVDDLDLATQLEPLRTIKALRSAGLRVVPTGLAHGTVTAVSGGRPYEITTLRRDEATDGRHALVAFTDSWAEDAARRDFRLNALYADASGRIFDPTGEGLADALAGRVIFVGEARIRIQEDYLRILRFFRFHAWFGRGELYSEGLAACSELSSGLSQLSSERVSRELLKLLAAPDPAPSVRAMVISGVMAHILPEGIGLAHFERMVQMTGDPELRLAALLPRQVDAIQRLCARLRLPNRLRERLSEAAGDLPMELSDRQAREQLYRIGREPFRDRLLLDRAADRIGEEKLQQGLEIERLWIRPSLPVGGRQVAAAGLAPGPQTGIVLKRFEEGWIADDFPVSGHAERLRAVIGSLSEPS